MRILQLGKYWRQDGGIETHVKSLCKGLAKRGVEVVNLVSSLDRSSSDFEADGYRVVEAASLGVVASTAVSPAMLVAARRLHRDRPFDIIHMHFPDPMAHLVSMLMPRRVPRVITWHSDIIRQKRLLRFYRPFQLREIRLANAIVAATEAHFRTSTQIPADYPSQHRHVIPYGMEYEWLDRTPRIDRHVQLVRARANGRFIVFALGRHVSYKGFDTLLDAVRGSDAFLVLGGEGPLSGELAAQADRLAITDQVWFTGRITPEQVAACYHACDAFCLPSVTQAEAFGLVQLEAMACGKPVICTQLGNGVNAVNLHQITGITVPIGSADAIRDAIKSLEKNVELRHALGDRAKAHARATYAADSSSQLHLATYAGILAVK